MRVLLFILLMTAAANAAPLPEPRPVPPPVVQTLVSPFSDCPYLPAAFRHNRTFDKLFRRAARKHWPLHWDWCLLKAQCARESSLRADATSPARARGLCQFLDGTLRDVGRKLRRNLNPYSPRDNVEAAAVYMAYLYRGWSSPRPFSDRISLALGSYNAGMGNLLKAQVLSCGARLWPDIGNALYAVTGNRHATETTVYVYDIMRWSGLDLSVPKLDMPYPPECR